MANGRGIIQELETFLKELGDYRSYRNEMKRRVFTRREAEQVSNLRQMLVQKSGKYKKLIFDSTGIENASIVIDHKEYMTNIWSVGLLANPARRTRTALDYCIDSVGQTIGKLEDDIKRGIRDEKEKESIKELELILHGTPDMILKCIQDVAERPNSQRYNFSFRRTSGRPDYAKWDKTYFASCAISQGDEGQIGTIKLQLLPKEKTSFKYLEPKNWTSSFGYFLNSLFAEFQKLGFVDLAKEKPIIKTEPQQIARRHKLWRWAKNNKLWSILIVGIPVLAALIYVIDYIWKLFSK